MSRRWQALANHPLLRSHLDTSPGLEPQWIELAEWLPPIDWDQAGVPLRFSSGEGIDLGRDTGLRLWVRTGSGLDVDVHFIMPASMEPRQRSFWVRYWRTTRPARAGRP